MSELLIVVPVYGQHDYTHALVGDLEREHANYLIIDNKGDYPRTANEQVIQPGKNLGWAGGSQLGFTFAFANGYTHAMTLNNDTRISKGFVTALLDPRLPADAGITGPMTDIGFPCAQADPKPAAAHYTPQPKYRTVLAVEGTALMLTRACWDATGGIDVDAFGEIGWGADLDLAHRARTANFGIYTLETAYINHFERKTAYTIMTPRAWNAVAGTAMERNMRKRYGAGWRELFPPSSWIPCDKAPEYTTFKLGD